MTHPWVVVAGVIALAVLYVLLPVVADAFRRFRGPRALRCPETGSAAEVGVDARHAALTASVGAPRLRVERCSLWPERHECGEECLRQLDGAEPVAPSRRG